MANAEVSKRIKESKAAGGKMLDVSGLDLTDKDLSQLPKSLPGLESLKLDGCARLTDAALKTVGRMTKLKELSLRGQAADAQKTTVGSVMGITLTGKFTAKGMAFLADLKTLTELDLNGRAELTDDCLEHIGKLKSLRSLNLSACVNITDNGVGALAGLKKLESLLLNFCFLLTDECFKYLEPLVEQKLRRIEFADVSHGIDGVEQPGRISVAPELLFTADAKAIVNAWKSGQEFLEARIAFVGMEGVGKTSLLRRCFLDEVLTENEARRATVDIDQIQSDLLKWKPTVVTAKGERVVAPRIWDFGRKFVEYGVHEPFFTSQDRTLFVVVLSAKRLLRRRLDEDENEIGNGLDYWLKSLAHFAGKDAPVLVVVTQCDEFDPDDTRPIDPLPSPEDLCKATSAKVIDVVDWCSACESDADSIGLLRTAIEDALSQLPGLLTNVSPDLWRLNELVARNLRGCLSASLDDYRKWCDQCGIPESQKQDTYLRALHQLGTLFFFGLTNEEETVGDGASMTAMAPGQRRFASEERDSVLRRFVINPHWWKAAVCHVIDRSSERRWWSRSQLNEEVQAGYKNFTAGTRNNLEGFRNFLRGEGEGKLAEAWTAVIESSSLAKQHDLDLIEASLKLTELCFRDKQRRQYLFPRGFPQDDLVTTDEWPRATASFDFIPEAAFHRFLVKLHRGGKVACSTRGRQEHRRWSVIAWEPGDEKVRVAVVAAPDDGRIEFRLDPSSDEMGRLVLALQLYDTFNGDCMGGAGPTASEVFERFKGTKPHQPAADTDECPFTGDYCKVKWRGMEFTFKGRQVAIMEFLWQRRGKSPVHEKSIGKKIKSSNARFQLIDPFRNSKLSTTHPAWGTLIVKVENSYYSLAEGHIEKITATVR
ncbi:MAG: hypothetical protein WD768_23260 [Phycisphaeraceae bacterium]